MARLPRLAMAGQAHLVALQGHSGQAVFMDDDDRAQFLAALRESALQQAVAVHAYCLREESVLLLATPARDGALGALMQGLGRRYGAAFNRRHGRSGSLWAGRYRTAVVQAGVCLQDALLWVDALALGEGGAVDIPSARWSSAALHLGQSRDSLVTECAAWWALGNTPFEREAAYRHLLQNDLPPDRRAALDAALRKGWALGDAAYLAKLAQQFDRPAHPRPRGRPPKSAAA